MDDPRTSKFRSELLSVNTNRPKVSVVIPAYNAEKWIYECIHSILVQDYPLHEIIVVDDASTDKTGDIVKDMAKVHKSIIYILHETNKGECVASYNGFEKATGDYICRLSADDTFVKYDHLSKQVTVMEDTRADWCYNSTNFSGTENKFGEISTITSYWLPIPLKYTMKIYQNFDNIILSNTNLALAIIMIRNPVNSSTLMWRSSAYKQAKWCTKYRTDCDGMILMRMLLKGLRGVAIPDIGAFYRIHEAQGSYNPKYREDMKEVRKVVAVAIQNGDYPDWLKKYSTRFL